MLFIAPLVPHALTRPAAWGIRLSRAMSSTVSAFEGEAARDPPPRVLLTGMWFNRPSCGLEL